MGLNERAVWAAGAAVLLILVAVSMVRPVVPVEAKAPLVQGPLNMSVTEVCYDGVVYLRTGATALTAKIKSTAPGAALGISPFIACK